MPFLNARRNYVFICLIVATSAVAYSTESSLTFKDHGTEVKKLEQTALESLAGPQSWTVYEPHEKKERSYRVMPFTQLMDKVYGVKWRNAEEILFTCIDGYQPSIPTEKFLKYEAGIAFPENTADSFELVNTLQNNEKISLKPYYLIWNNLKSKDLRMEGASDIPYQVVGIDLIAFSAKFPKLFPGKNATASVTAGFLHFRKHCLNCHTINGDGGGKAPELNIPMNVTEYWKPKALKQWIANPASVRHNTTMPALNPDLPERRKVIDQIVSYLKAMSKNKQL